MKSILLIIPYGSVGGMERLALNFYNFYKGKGYKVKTIKFIKLPTDLINFNEDEYYFSSKDFFELSFLKRFLFYLKAPLKIRNIIKSENISHSISFGDMANVFSSLSFTNEFKVASIHALKSVEFMNKNMLNTIFKWSLKTSYQYFSKVVCISQGIKEDLIENCGYPFNNLDVIYNPHDIKNIQELSFAPITETSEIKIFSKPCILFLGRLSIQKAPWHLLNAFYMLKEDNVNLVFIGDGDLSVIKYLNKLIKRYNLSHQVFFLGRKNNPYKYIKNSKVLALSSYYEGTPNVIVESIALNVPVVTTNCTKGILELMSIKKIKVVNKLTITESGIVTPNIFKGILNIPKDSELIDYKFEEEELAKALNYILINEEVITNTIYKNYDKLLSKYDLNTVTTAYLKKP